MLKLNEKKDCTGCHACASVCPRRCITMTTDVEGFLYPEVDMDACIACGRCLKVCPVLHPYGVRKPEKVYAARTRDEAMRMQSSSGGVFTMLAEAILRRQGVVFGASFDAEWQVRHTRAETLEELEPLRGTKYVQSVVGDVLREAKACLRGGRWVLFSGTPCQIAGLRHFLGKEEDRLLTVEVVCHGVPSPLVWSTYLEEITPKGERIVDVRMRDKACGWNAYGMTIATDKRMLYRGKAKHNVFSRGFLSDFYLRPSCHACPAKGGSSGADITLGDFWGVKRIHPSMDDDRGVSLVLLRSSRGVNFFKGLDVIAQETDYAQVLQANPAIVRSAALTPFRQEFWRRFPREGMKVVNRLWWKKKVMSVLRRLKIWKNKNNNH